MYLPLHADLARSAAEWAIDRFAGDLPDLARLTILAPTGALLRPLRESFHAAARARGHEALLGPTLAPFALWPSRRLGGEDPAPLSREAAELQVFEALRTVPGLARGDSRWQLAESLLGLFVELGTARVAAPPDLDTFRQHLRHAYGTPKHLDAPLSREARLVYSAWQAWRTQLAARGCEEPAATRAEQWRRALAEFAPDEFLLVLQPDDPGPAVAELLRGLRAEGRAELLLRGNAGFASGPPVTALATALDLPPPPPPDAIDGWIDSALDGHADAMPLARRARLHHDRAPVDRHWRRVAAADAEDEARAVALAAVEHLAVHRDHRVVIGTENRRLARRVRALLERFGLPLGDQGGWATSTSRAAALLERWLECIEGDFDRRPLLDVLQSSFLRDAGIFDGDRDRFDAAVHHFERDIVRHENLARGLAAYRDALWSRSRRLGRWSRHQREDVHTLLQVLERAAGPLRRVATDRPRPALEFLAALQRALDTLGVGRTLGGDDAGRRVLAVLARLREAAAAHRVDLAWRDFRTWTGRALEQEPFTPAAHDARVVLADLARAADLPADCLILGGADSEHLPAAPGGAPFFNDGVRTELGLATWDDRWQGQLHRFRRALGTAPHLWFTHAVEQDGEPIAASPWLEALDGFHRLAFDEALGDGGLLARTRAFDRDCHRPLPGRTGRPAPAVPAERLPARLPASRHGDLIACPYRFFAGNVLGLEPLEEVREELEKADYGERIHRALEAFWQPVRGMPAPWSGPLDDARRAAAEAHLRRAIEAAFADDLTHHFAHRAWRRRALSLVPALIGWAIAHARNHAFEQGEARASHALAPGLELYGRLDRVDRRAEGGLAVTDYKTGTIARPEDLRAGEDVQLTSYALLAEDVRAARYLEIRRERCRAVGLEDDELARLAAAVGQRLLRLWERMAAGTPLPAWPNALCTWCRYEGLCRRPLWLAAGEPTEPATAAAAPAVTPGRKPDRARSR